MNTVARTIGAALGAQSAASILAAQPAPEGSYPTDAAFTGVYALTALAAVAACAAAFTVPRRPAME